MKRVAIIRGLSSRVPAVEDKLVKSLGKAKIAIVAAAENPEAIIVIGGDGAMLDHVSKTEHPELPIVGINAGSLGFLQEAGVADVEDLVRALREDTYFIQKLPLISVRKCDEHKKYYAFNEMVMERASSRAAHLMINIDGTRFEKFIGDGILIATPQGSTAYASAAGGAAIDTKVAALQLVPVNPHESREYHALRAPLVLAADSKIIIEPHDDKYRPVRLVTDGHTIAEGVDAFEVRMAPQPVSMLHMPGFSYIGQLARTLLHQTNLS
jgi:NAD+ kinase